VLVLAVVLLIAFTLAAAEATARISAPPPGLTAQGRLLWQLDALVRDQVGGSACVIYRNTSIVPARQCRDLPLSQAGGYVPTFRSARRSVFRVVATQTLNLGNVVLVLVRGRYVQCSAGYYLSLQHGGGLTGLALGCVTRLP
jgi:hypothetical protein